MYVQPFDYATISSNFSESVSSTTAVWQPRSEAFHRQLRRVTMIKDSLTSDMALMKLLFLVQGDVTAKRRKPMHNWNRILSELAIFYDERLHLDL